MSEEELSARTHLLIVGGGGAAETGALSERARAVLGAKNAVDNK